MTYLLERLPLVFYIEFFGWMLILGVLFAFTLRVKFWGRSVVFAILAILVMRIILFSNPVAWTAYDKFLDIDDLGFRNNKLVSFERNKFLRRPQKVEYLAVGSSQVGAVFGRYDYLDKSNQFITFTLAGMTTMEYVLYKDHIAKYQPKNIILYLSEFGLSRQLQLTQLSMAPPQGFDSWRVFWLLREAMGNYSFYSYFKQLMFSSFFPEYKYSYVFKGMMEKIFGKKAALNERHVTDVSAMEYMDQHLKQLKGLNAKFTEFHFVFLEEFIRFCQEKSINIVLVEGDYHPLAYSEKNRQLNKTIKNKFSRLAERYKHITYVPRKTIYEFTEHDFRDGYHVHKRVGLEFTKKLLDYLDGL